MTRRPLYFAGPDSVSGVGWRFRVASQVHIARVRSDGGERANDNATFAAAGPARETLELVAEMGAALATASGYDRVLAAVGSVAVPALADLCAADILEQGRLRALQAT